MTDLRNLNRGDGAYFGPEDELTDEQIYTCTMKAIRELVESNGYDKELNLETDEEAFRVPGQNVALVSFIGPYDLLKVKHDKFQINLRGATGDVVSARKRINKITQEGTVYDIFTLGMYEWVAIPPNISFMQDNDLHEDFLNGIIVKHKKDLLTKKYMFEMRKELINKSKKTAQVIETEEPINEPTEEPVLKPTDESDTPSTDATLCAVEEPVIPKVPNEIPLFSSTPSQTDEFDSSEKLNQCASNSQNWVIFSTVGNLTDGMAIKIQGFYDTEEYARKVMERKRQIDDTFETYVAEAYRWLPVEHNVDDIEDQVFQDDNLNKLYKTHIEEKKKAEDYNRVQKSKGNAPSPSQILGDLERSPR
jgi:hypothetical protein